MGKRISTRYRASRGLPEKKSILIICEGNVEKWYFDDLFCDANHLNHYAIVHSKDPIKIVEHCIKKIERGKNRGRIYDHAWCVFDRDKTKPEIIKTAGKLAQKHNVKIGFSNPCFELWILSHFKKINSSIKGLDLKKELRICFGIKYVKNEKFILKKVLPKILLLTNVAISNTEHFGETPCLNSPYTNLAELVSLLYEEDNRSL